MPGLIAHPGQIWFSVAAVAVFVNIVVTFSIQ